MLYFDENKYDNFLNLIVHAQKSRYNANNLFRKSEIYYKSQNEMNAVEKTLNEWIRYFIKIYIIILLFNLSRHYIVRRLNLIRC